MAVLSTARSSRRVGVAIGRQLGRFQHLTVKSDITGADQLGPFSTEFSRTDYAVDTGFILDDVIAMTTSRGRCASTGSRCVIICYRCHWRRRLPIASSSCVFEQCTEFSRYFNSITIIVLCEPTPTVPYLTWPHGMRDDVRD